MKEGATARGLQVASKHEGDRDETTKGWDRNDDPKEAVVGTRDFCTKT